MNEKKDLVEGALHATSACGGGTYLILRLITQEVERVRLVPRLEVSMLGKVLLPENIARTDGIGSDIDLASDRGKLLVITLGIDRVLEQEALSISVWGSSDTSNWGVGPLMSFPSKYYCGRYSRLLNLANHPDVRYLRVEWKMTRWARGEITPLFSFYVFAEASGARVCALPPPRRAVA
jgi:hypothetical protein